MAAMDKAIEKILDLYPDYEPKLEDEPYFKTRLKELRTERLKKLSFSVSKKAEEIGMEPAYVVSVSQEEIYQRGYTHLEELFHDLPGFTANTIKGLYYTQLYQRGYRSSNATDRTLIMVNGVEDNSLFSSVAYISRQYPLSNIKKVEVIYGPASTIYGPNAFTGVINIVTKEIYDYFPNEENLHVMADAGYGTYNTRYGDITVAGERNEVWGSATARWFQSDEMDLTNQSVNISGTDLFYWDGLWDEGYAIDSVYTQGLTTDDTAAMAAIAQSDPAGLWHYTQGNTVYPTDTAIARAQELDRMNYGALDPELRAFDNPTNDYFLGATLGYKGFKLSVQHWQRQEGRTATHIDRRLAHASEASELTVQSTLLSAWYQQAITNRLTIFSHTRYKRKSDNNNTRQIRYSSYAGGQLSLVDLLDTTAPGWGTSYDFQSLHQFRTELTAVYRPLDNFDLITGFEYRFTQGPQNDLTGPLPLPENTGGGSRNNEVLLRDVGLYTQATWDINDQIRLVAGARIDYNVTVNRFAVCQGRSPVLGRCQDLKLIPNNPDSLREFGDISQEIGPRYFSQEDGIQVRAGYGLNWNPRLVLMYRPQETLTIKVLYAQAYKAPTLVQLYKDDGNNLPNPSLAPEQVRNLELNALWYPKETINRWNPKLEGVLYYSWYEGSPIFDPSSRLTRFINSDQNTRILGLNLNGKVNPLPWIQAWGNYSLTYGSREATAAGANSIRVGDIPLHQFNLGTHIRHPKVLPWLGGHIRLNHVGEKLTGAATTISDNPLTHIDRYSVVNTAFTLYGNSLGAADKGWSDLELQLIVNNALNKSYWASGLREADNLLYAPIIPQEGRHFIIRLRYTPTKKI
ncbi:MAG TPA: hypothetical protein DCE41_32570 [Cytophagales bacterium]|nr:hypothetical protein [Cytophagales bacterium]HAP64418.1 hypothetical protein [Cytophagales bacterium]